MIRWLVALIAWLVPPPLRPRWREEWAAEIAHVTSWRDRFRLLAGALPDALAARRIHRHAARQIARAGAFAGFDLDLRFALRGLVKSPAFAAGAISSLAIGIAATATAFSFMNAAVFRPFPEVSAQDELVRLTVGRERYQKFSTRALPYRDYTTARDTLTTMSGVAAVRNATFAIMASGQVASVPGALVSSNYFTVLGVRPAAGRFFVETEDGVSGAPPAVVISDSLWLRLFARAPSAIGASMLINGADVRIVGVAPPAFIGVRRAEDPPRLWLPMAMAPLTLRDRDGRPADVHAAGPLWLDLVGRRRSAITFEQAQAEVATLRARLEATANDPLAHVSAMRVWMNDPSRLRGELAAFMAIPLVVLAIACVNAANLVLARSRRNVRDWTVRLAIGATRWRLLRQVVAEALLLSVTAAAIGLLITRWAVSLAAHQFPVPIPIDARVLLFTVGVAFATSLGFSVGPGLAVTRSAAERLAAASSFVAGRVRSRTRFALVAFQAALSLGLLATGAQFTARMHASAPREHVPSPETLAIGTFDLDPLRYEPGAGEEFYRRLVDRVRRVPGVAAAGLSTRGLVIGTVGRDVYARVLLPGAAEDGKRVLAYHVSSGFLDAMGVPMRQGRRFDAPDADRVASVVVNQAFADKLLGGHALGRTFRMAAPPVAPRDGVEAGMILIDNGVARFSGNTATTDTRDVTVIGVVGGILKRGELEPPILYYPAPLVYQPARTLYLRLAGSGAFDAAALHQAVREVDARVPVIDLATLAEIRDRSNEEVRVLTNAAGVLGIVALILAAGGLYSVVSYVVSQRRRELGIRVALGASSARVVRTIVTQALTPTLVGASIGAAGAAAAGMIIRSQMYGVTPVDPVAFGGATTLMLAVMTLATWLPARQAARIDPVTVLRED
jgi:predicted permease